MLNMSKFRKCAYNLFGTSKVAAGATTEVAPKSVKSPRLFTISKDSVIGTEIRNNITGTRYFQRGAINGRDTSIGALTTVYRPNGTYTGMPNEQFNKLLKELQQNPNNWNPVINSDAAIGKELLVNNPQIAGRYFRPNNNDIVGNLIMHSRPDGRYSSMTLEQFDNMILNLLG